MAPPQSGSDSAPLVPPLLSDRPVELAPVELTRAEVPAQRLAQTRAQQDSPSESGGLVIADTFGRQIHEVPPDVAGALRFFVTRLLRADSFGMPATLAVTSALAGEGVTFAARSIAAIVAHDFGRSVCVVETNWWRAAQRPRRGAREASEPREGLAEVLAGRVSLDDVIVPTSDANLCLLPAGRAPLSKRPVIAASDAFAKLLAVLTSRFDAVILDVPPVLKASESLAFCRRCEATVVVVRQGVTTERQVAHAIESLEGVELLGIMFNRSSTRIPRFLQRFTVPI